MFPTRSLALALFIPLIACGTPQERCISQSTRELRNVQSLLEEVEGNIQRGYAWTYRDVRVPRWQYCGYYPPVRRDARPQPRMCMGHDVITQRRRVAIDPAAEARKRDGLLARRDALTRSASAQIEQCRIVHPQ